MDEGGSRVGPLHDCPVPESRRSVSRRKVSPDWRVYRRFQCVECLSLPSRGSDQEGGTVGPSP